MLIEIVDYRESWPSEFLAAAGPIREALGDRVSAIHHIGSTAVPALAAKDIIDVQLTVSDLGVQITEPLTSSGFAWRRDISADHLPPGADIAAVELLKHVFTERAGERRMNIHARLEGAFNQRYAVLFRDYLRTHREARAAYGRLKRAIADIVVDDADHYYAVKDPAIDMLMTGANIWAETTGWQVPPSDA